MRPLLLIGLLGCKESPPPPPPPPPAEVPKKATKTEKALVYRSHRAMGSQITITAFTADEAGAIAAFEAVFAEFDRLENALTTWRKESDVSRINRAAGEAPVQVSAETLEVVQHGIRLAKATEGKFDITFGALSGLWKFDHDQDNRIPSAKEIGGRLPLIGWEAIVVKPEDRRVGLAKAGMKMHLGGVGKGFAVDKGVAILRAAGVEDFMLQAGGDLYVAGHKGGRNWRVGIRDPRGGPSTYFAAAEVTDATFSTSGDYERFFEKGGKRYHHIIDPDVGRPARGCRSVTVMAPDAVTADGLSTGIFILGPEKGLPILEGLPGVGAVIVDAQNRVHISERLKGRVKILSPPTP